MKGQKMGRKVSIGLPGNSYKPKRKQKTVSGYKFVVKSRSYYGTFAGWDIYINDQFIRFNNGLLFENPTDPNECMNWAIDEFLFVADKIVCGNHLGT